MNVYEELVERVGMGKSRIAERLFEMLADEVDARLMLAMPAQTSALAEKFQLSPEEAEARVQEMFHKGLVFPSRKTDPPTYRMVRHVDQFHDATILWEEAPQEFLDLWQEYIESDWPTLARARNETEEKPLSRIVPVNVSIEATTQILDFESVQELVTKAERLAVTKCTCRLTAHKCDSPLETCIQLNRGATYNIERGTGREIDAGEALDLLRNAEKEGLIHVTMNKHQADLFICNCCPCCCLNLPILIKGGIRLVAPSRYRAQIDPELCIGCGTCEDRCHFGAPRAEDGQGGVHVIDAGKCLGCGLCQIACPGGAIALVEALPKDFVPG